MHFEFGRFTKEKIAFFQAFTLDCFVKVSHCSSLRSLFLGGCFDFNHCGDCAVIVEIVIVGLVGFFAFGAVFAFEGGVLD